MTQMSLLAQSADFGVTSSEVRCADKPDLGLFHFADAASICICGTLIVAARHKSPIRSFVDLEFIRTETAFSLQADLTIETRTFRTFDARLLLAAAPAQHC